MNSEEFRLISEALAFAARKHRDQRRKDASQSPYINHPISLVEILVAEAGVQHAEILCAAILHDTVEDTATSEDELRERFGDSIGRIVMEVTDEKGLAKQARKDAQVAHAPVLSIEAKAVKLADKISNLRDLVDAPPPSWSLARRQEYFDWAKAVVDGLRGDHPRLEAIFDRQYLCRPEQ